MDGWMDICHSRSPIYFISLLLLGYNHMKQELTKFLAGFANSGKVSSYNTIKW